MKIIISGKDYDSIINSGKYSCGVCGRNLGVKSVLCTECGKLIHKRWFRLQSVVHARDFDYACPTRARRRLGSTVWINDSIVDGLTVNDLLEEVETFCCLGSSVCKEGGVDRAVHDRVVRDRTNWHEVSGILCNRKIPLKNMAHLYSACTPSVLLIDAKS